MDQPNDEPIIRPVTRGDCRGGIRPCPFVGCRFNLLLDVNPTTGSIAFNHAAAVTLVTNDDTDDRFDQAAETATDAWAEADVPSCALDVVDAELADETPIADVARILGVSRQRVDQIVSKAVVTVRKRQGLEPFAL